MPLRKEPGPSGQMPPLLGAATLHVWRLNDDKGLQKGATLEIRNDKVKYEGDPKIYIKWVGGEMTLFVEEHGKKPELIRKWNHEAH